MAAHTLLPTVATLRSIAMKLEDKFSFVPAAFAVINRYERERGSVVLRLGVSKASKGKRPNYRIDDAKTCALVQR
jgi:hypothetical protein